MKNISQKPSQLWEQWLNKLHGIEDPQKKYFRLELLQLLLKCEEADKKTFLHRLGTIMSRSLQNGRVLIVDNTNKKIIFEQLDKPNLKKVSEKSIFSLLPSGVKDVSIKTFTRSKNIIGKNTPVKNICQVPIKFVFGSDIRIVILATEGLNSEDRQFLQFVSGLMKVFENKSLLSRELAQEQRLLGLLTQHLNEGLVLLSKDMAVTLWNRPLQRITGYSPKESKGKLVEDIIQLRNQGRWLQKLVKDYNTKRHQNSFVQEGQVKAKNGNYTWISISGSFLRDERGEIEQIIALVRDINSDKLSEERKNEFISIATHELRTPITAIKGYLSLFKKESKDLSGKQQIYLENILSATDRLVKLTEDLLQVTRLEEDRMKFNIGLVDLTTIIKKVSDDFSEKARGKGLSFNLHLPPYPTTIAGDSTRLVQIFSNLVDNAIKYTEKGSINISFEHYSEKLTKEDKVAVIIKDTGVGIDTKDIEDIFNKFHRTERAANLREPGVGLGLYIVKSFIEKQGGVINVKSRAKKGSTFAVTFPVAVATNKKIVNKTLAEEKIGSSMRKVK